jgi:DNA-binding transcriptional ArsR family regulator
LLTYLGWVSTAPSIDLDALARIGEALADENRQRILVHLLGRPTYPADLADRLGLGRTNVSNHLACLRGCGLVTATPEGRRIRYELADPRLAEALTILSTLELGQSDGCRHQP